MKIKTKIMFLLLFSLILTFLGYTIYTFIELIWFLLPTGILLSAMLLTPIFQATPLKLNTSQKQSFLQNKKSPKYNSLKVLWIFWSLAASIFITFFNGFIGNIIWCLLTLIFLFVEIYFKKKKLAIEQLINK